MRKMAFTRENCDSLAEEFTQRNDYILRRGGKPFPNPGWIHNELPFRSEQEVNLRHAIEWYLELIPRQDEKIKELGLRRKT